MQGVRSSCAAIQRNLFWRSRRACNANDEAAPCCIVRVRHGRAPIERARTYMVAPERRSDRARVPRIIVLTPDAAALGERAREVFACRFVGDLSARATHFAVRTAYDMNPRKFTSYRSSKLACCVAKNCNLGLSVIDRR